MVLALLPPLFHRFNREFFDGEVPYLRLSWSDGRLRKTAGRYRRDRNGAAIELSTPVLSCLPEEATHSTLVHEMIHAWVDLVLRQREKGHGPLFLAKMEEINAAEPGFRISVRHCFPTRPQRPRWQARCDHCGLVTPYRRRTQGLACRRCCERFNGGRWDRRFLLRFEERME